MEPQTWHGRIAEDILDQERALAWRRILTLCEDRGLMTSSLRGPVEDRVLALESLWSAWKKVHASGVGYDPAFHEAVKRLEELERGQ